jgi:hypothetical protein
MRKLVLAAAAVTLLLTRGSQPAEARCGSDCPPLLEALNWTFAAGLAGGYAYGTGYFIYHDATDATQSLGHGGAELGLHAPLALMFTGITAGAIDRGRVGQAALFGALSLTHGALAGHGAWRVFQHRAELIPEPQTLVALAGIAYGANTLMWGLSAPGHHGRGYGVAEAAVNAPLAAGLGYLAADRARGGDTREAVLFGGMAALSGALVLHGAYLALRPERTPSIEDLNFDLGRGLGVGADLAPTVVTDGKDVAPGLGASGTW